MIASDSHKFERLLEVLRPKRVFVMVSFEGYFDESGSFDEDPGIFCVSGYFFTKEAALVMDAKWRQVLKDHGIPYFHMVDCAHGMGVFKEKSKKERIEIQTKLMDLIKQYVIEGFSVIMKKDVFETDEYLNPYTHGAEVCVETLKHFLKFNRLDGNIAYFFESGHSDKNSASKRMGERLREDIDTLTFATKYQVALLQAADILAWQTTKYVKDKMSGVRKPRADFMSLMQRDHTFFYPFFTEDKSMSIELWPIEKRTNLKTLDMKINDDGPIPYAIFDGDEKMPVIFVNHIKGWRQSWGQMIHVIFDTMGDKEVALSLTHDQHWNAILGLMQATDAYQNKDLCITLPALNLAFEKRDKEALLRIKMSTGADIVFKLSDEMLNHLKKLINS